MTFTHRLSNQFKPLSKKQSQNDIEINLGLTSAEQIKRVLKFQAIKKFFLFCFYV